MAVVINGTTGVSGVDGSAGTPAVQGTDTNTGIFYPAADTIAFAEGGVEVARINSDAQFVASAGTASLPVYTTTGDTNTGIFFPAADTIAFTEGGTESMRIDSSGNLGIGNSTARARLTVSDGTVNTAGEAVYQGYIVGADRSGLTEGNLAIQSNDAMAIDKGGSLSFGGRAVTSSTAGANWARIAGRKETGTSAEYGGYLQFATRPNSGAMAERARITSTGKFFVNETAEIAGYSEQAVITANGTSVALALKSADSSIALATTTTNTNTYNAAVFANNGSFSGALKGSISVSNTGTTYNTTSDYRLKENVAPMTGALATVAQLKPCTYTWKDGGEIGQGFIAHELQAVVPDCVTGEKDAVDADGKPIYQGVDTSFLVATLTAAIQELKAELDTTKARLAALEAK